MLDVNLEFNADMINHDNNYVGEKYGVPTPEGLKATKLLAKKEGIILDPVYTSKGFSALIDYVKKGIIKNYDISWPYKWYDYKNKECTDKIA